MTLNDEIVEFVGPRKHQDFQYKAMHMTLNYEIVGFVGTRKYQDFQYKAAHMTLNDEIVESWTLASIRTMDRS